MSTYYRRRTVSDTIEALREGLGILRHCAFTREAEEALGALILVEAALMYVDGEEMTPEQQDLLRSVNGLFASSATPFPGLGEG